MFTITITPCVVASYNNVSVQGDITDRIGDPDKTQGTYSFVESPNVCGYTPTISVTGLPVFVFHNTVNRKFTILKSSDESLIGAYPVTIKSTIKVWNDYTKTTFKEYTAT